MSELDERLRLALRDLDDQARSALRPPGPGGIPAAARRRRVAVAAGGTALALLLAAALVWVARPPAPEHPAGAPSCAPAEGGAFLPAQASEQQREQLQAAIAASPEIVSYTYQSAEEAWAGFQNAFRDAPDLVAATKPDSLAANFRFDLRCAGDFPAVRDRLMPFAVDVFCNGCGAVHEPGLDKPVLPAQSPSSAEPTR
ncbi:permease-like cell division protein FtsX [Dactylosporangium sp. McL0621]|uniref:permease-like cell division protein FtsX n=1 Tax=Dactylosporangium sp. McL0621 TaxID=3415678 RepID=UPI003CE6D5EE